MVSANPVKRLYRYWEASVINDVIVDVAFFTLIAMSAYSRLLRLRVAEG